MIFQHPLLTDTDQLQYLLALDIPQVPQSYEAHQAALFWRLRELIEAALAEGEDPLSLIETYLQIPALHSDTESLAFCLLESPPFQAALHQLRQNWAEIEPAQLQSYAPESINTNEILSEPLAPLEFAQITLTDFLERLSMFQD